MSFVDLATLAVHRRHEMEIRISTFSSKCDLAINDIRKLKSKARSFVERLNCEPVELKDRFLSCMKQLDEYIYLMTDFNLAISKLEENGSVDMAPVQDNNSYMSYPVMTPTNLLDVLSEPAPSTSSACQNMCVERPRRKRIPKEEQLLIAFSSTSCSAESVPEARASSSRAEKEVQCVAQDLSVKGGLRRVLCVPYLFYALTQTIRWHPDPSESAVNLPAQATLQTDQVYQVHIMNVDGPSIWIVVGDCVDLLGLIGEMDKYYKEHEVVMSPDEVPFLSCCVFYDKDALCHYRALFLELTTQQKTEVKVFLVDTGELRSGGVDCIKPLVPRFCALPPFARCCHLADVELICDDQEILNKYDEFMKTYLAKQCSMRVDDNTSESLGVYFLLDKNTTLNELLVQEGLALAIDKPSAASSCGALDVADAPEHTDAVEAVAGYSNRDEIDICKHYKGGPDKTCFKGARCKKRHVLKHPDGWTLDRMSIPTIRSLPLPEPGSWRRVTVTYVCHFDRVFVQLAKDAVQEELPSFGVVLPPTTLEGLLRDMNSPAARMAFKKLDVAPAPGELVAALYPLDDQWYRARVTSSTRADQSVQVEYIDFGNMMWVKEDAVRALEPRFLALPAQAVRCRLAGVAPRDASSKHWAAAKAALGELTMDQTLDAHVIAREFDEIVVEIFDAQGYSIAELLEARGLVSYEPFQLEDDSTRTFHVGPP